MSWQEKLNGWFCIMACHVRLSAYEMLPEKKWMMNIKKVRTGEHTLRFEQSVIKSDQIGRKAEQHTLVEQMGGGELKCHENILSAIKTKTLHKYDSTKWGRHDAKYKIAFAKKSKANTDRHKQRLIMRMCCPSHMPPTAFTNPAHTHVNVFQHHSNSTVMCVLKRPICRRLRERESLLTHVCQAKYLQI